MELEALLLVAGSAIILAAGFVRGLTGFGLGMVAVPLLSIIFSPKIVVPAVIIQTILTNVPLVWTVRHDLRPMHMWPLITSAVVGLPAGILLLRWLDPDPLRLFIGATVTVTAVLMLAGFHANIRRERVAFVPVGLASGVLNGTSALSGPPVVLFFANQEMPPKVFRANILFFFFASNTIAVPIFLASGLVNADVLVMTFALFPALAIGTWLGARFAGRVQATVFKRLTLGVVLLAGVSSIGNGLGLY